MNKALTNAHKNETCLRNRYLKNRSEENRATCTRCQSNCCVSILRKTKTNSYGNLNHKDLANNKFKRTVKPLFTDKMKSNEKINLVQSEKILKEDKKSCRNFKFVFFFFFPTVLRNIVMLIHCQKEFLISNF